MGSAPVSAPTSGGLKDTTAGVLAYITFIPAIFFLVSAPYNKNNFVRFHSFQCLFLTGVSICANILSFVPFLGLLAMVVIHIAVFVGWIICIIKASQGQKFKLPVIGDLAEKQADAF